MKQSLTYTCTSSSVEETQSIAASLASFLHAGDLVLLSGDLGAGKTHFVQGIAQALGITEAVTSPTFPIVMMYEDVTLPLYHFDLYRLESEEELEDIGFFEIIEGEGVSFIEWGDKFPDALPSDYLSLHLQVDPDGTRNLHLQASGERSSQLLASWIQSRGV